MSVMRIPTKAIETIMGGGLRDSDKTTVVVKFYSNGCHFCHALSEYYLDISEEEKYEGVYFFAHNVDDDGIIAEKLKLNGVPSIVLFQTQDGRCTKTRVLADPDKPHDKTWFTVKQIKTFINREI